jgi:ribosomal protein L23
VLFRSPSSGEFEAGEFTQLFAEVFDTVDLIFRDGMDWKALINTLKEVQVQNEDTPLQVQAIENKGDGVFIVKVHVPPNANKEKIHQELTEIYQIKAQLTAQDEQLKFLREQNTDLMQIIKIQAQNQSKVEISYNKQDQSQTITVGQDLTIEAKDSTVNLRDLHSSTQSSGENHEH